MDIHVDEANLKNGLMGLVIALVEVIRDVLRIEALKRMERGSLTEEECERLGKALMNFDIALEEIKEEQGITEAVQSVRDGLDEIVDDVINGLVNPEKWPQATESRGNGKQVTAGIGAGGSYMRYGVGS